MRRLLSALCVVFLPLLAGCTDAFDAQCDHLSEVDDQVACLDLAFVQLRIGSTEVPDREDLRDGERVCREGDEVWRGEDRYQCKAGQWGLWLEDDDEEDWDEEDEEEDWDEEEEREEGERDFCGLLDDRSEDRERCERVVRDLDGLHERIRGTVRQSEDADERRSLIREGLGEGRRLVEDETRSHPDRDVSREEEERRP